jgi:hypothetical protein
MTRALPLAVVVALGATAPAIAAPLRSTVSRMDIEPTLAVVPEASAATPVARYQARAPGPLSVGAPLVALIRLPPANSPDVVTVARARRSGHSILIELETRRFDGPLHGNDVTVPLVEVELGPLTADTYELHVTETVLRFTTFDKPETARDPHPGLDATMTFVVVH